MLGPLRHKFVPRFGAFPHYHTGEGLLHVVSLTNIPNLKQLLHWQGSLQDDYHAMDATPFDVETDEFVVEEAGSEATTSSTQTGCEGCEAAPSDPQPLRLFACMDESSFPVEGPLHFKVVHRPEYHHPHHQHYHYEA